MTQELTVALRIKSFLEDARRDLASFKTELVGLNTANKTAAAGTSAGANASTAAAGAAREQAKAVTETAAAANQAATATTRQATAFRTTATAAAAATVAQRGYTVSVGQTQAALRQLPAQFTDIFTSLAGGQNPLLVLTQQGGQIKDSFGGVKPALQQLTGLLTPFRIAVGLGAGAVGALALAFIKGREESAEFNRSLVLTGNRAGLIAGELDGMAQRVSTAVGATIGNARETLQALVSSGRVTTELLEPAARTIELFAATSGKSREAVLSDFLTMTDGVAKWALKLNEQVNFVDLALLGNIKRLEEQGKTSDAARVALEALSNHLGGDLRTNLGTIEQAFNSVARAMSGLKNAALSIGREPGLEDLVASAREALKIAEENARSPAFGKLASPAGQVVADRQVEEARQRLASLERTLAQARERAADQAAKAERNRAQIRAKEEIDAQLAKYDKAEELEKRLAEARRRFATLKGTEGEVSAAQQALIEKGIREDVLGKSRTASGNKPLQNARADAQVVQAQIAADLAALQASIKGTDAVIVQALADGNLSIRAAYDARLAGLQEDIAAQRQALTDDLAEVNGALAKAKTPAESGPLRRRQVEIQGKLRLLDGSLDDGARQLAQWKTAQERELATITAKIRVDVSSLTGTFDRAAVEQQLRQQFEGDFKAIGRIEDPGEQAQAKGRIELLIEAGAAQAEFNARLADSQRLQAQISVQEDAIRVRQQTGQISQIQAEAEIKNLRAAQVPTLLEIAASLERIRDTLPPEARLAIDGMNEALGRLRNTAAGATPVIVDLGTRLQNTAIDGLADAAATAVTNFQSLRSTIAATLRGIAADIIRSDIKRSLTDQFKVSGSGSNGGTSFFGLIATGVKSLFGFAEGGKIRGPGTGTSDSIPALVGGRKPIAVSDGEFIQPTRAVNHYGEAFMEAVRTLRFPKPGYAFGGLVQAHQRIKFASGGSVSAGAAGGQAGQALNVTFKLETRGTPQRVVGQQQNFDGKQAIVSVMLDDVRNGGPISRAYGVGN